MTTVATTAQGNHAENANAPQKSPQEQRQQQQDKAPQASGPEAATKTQKKRRKVNTGAARLLCYPSCANGPADFWPLF
jgi:hypothetical protein